MRKPAEQISRLFLFMYYKAQQYILYKTRKPADINQRAYLLKN
jgi:hypothetical protein